MRFFAIDRESGQESIRDWAAKCGLHVATILRLEGQDGRGLFAMDWDADSGADSSLDRRRIGRAITAKIGASMRGGNAGGFRA